MSENFSAVAYLLSSICFIMALRGLSSPVTARAGNLYGIAGMVIAIATTLASPGVLSYSMILLGAHRRLDRHGGRAPHPDDGPAAARRRLP